MKLKFAALCAPFALLAACGGGGSSSPPAGGPSPSPTPTPTPTPAPTPISYFKVDDLTGDQNFETACAGVQSVGGIVYALPATRFSEGLDLRFADASDTWTIARQGQSNTADFTPAEIVQSSKPGFVQYRGPNFFDLRDDSFFLGQGNLGGKQADYVRGFNLFWYIIRNDSDIEDNYCVFGVQTDTADTLPTTNLTYLDSAVDGVLFEGDREPAVRYDLSASQVRIATSSNAREITIALDLKGQQIEADGNRSSIITEIEDFNGAVSVASGTTNFAGTLQNPAVSNVRAAFAGSYFGPRGVEAGIVFHAQFQRADGTFVTLAGMVRAQQ